MNIASFHYRISIWHHACPLWCGQTMRNSWQFKTRNFLFI